MRFAAVFVLLAGCSVAETTQSESAPVTEDARPLDLEALVDLLKAHDIRSIDALLPELPVEFRSSYALMYDSRSLQSASYDDPRVIMFGVDARLTCTFNGDARQVGYDTLECFQFRESERAFDFRQIRFSEGAKALVSERDRTTDGTHRCSTCHGADPRPNWDKYRTWPGAYGFDDDALAGDAPAYASFVARRASHPRYRWLVQPDTPTAPYTVGYSATVARRPNLRFSDAAGRLNALRAKRLLDAKLDARERLQFAAIALGCQAGALEPLFTKIAVPGREWGLSISEPAKPWEHQSGAAFLTIDVGMAVAQDLARAGNPTLADALSRIVDYFPSRYTGADLAFHQKLAEIIPDPDKFGGHYEANTALVCSELQRLLTAL